MTETRHDPLLDPTKHMLVYPRYERQPDGSVTVTPILLDEAAAESRAGVEAVASSEPPLRKLFDNGVVVISPGRAWVIAKLVDELAKRLQPGLAVGPIESDGSLSRLAHDLAEDLYRRARP